MVSVAVSQLGKTGFAKINSACYCDHVLEQGLLPDIRCFSSDDMSTGTPITPQCGLPALLFARVHLIGTVASKYSVSCGLFSVESIAEDDVSLH